jgi:alpha-L-rhamnosidase
MNSKQKHILAILLGVEVGITLFFFFYTHPAISARIPGTQPVAVPEAITEPSASAPAATPTTAPITLLPPETAPPPSQVVELISTEPPPAPDTIFLGPVTDTEPPDDPALLARSFPETFAQTPPIWSHNKRPVEHEIVLFRHTFDVNHPALITELQIFADTRYEVWLDGVWIGRGPARFSCTLREYDVYPLETLSPGRHLIAVLVQWAPNARRSESNTPLLQARIQNYTPEGAITLTQTGPDWNVLPATAWKQDADQIHTWELIGPMELLDLNFLPQHWMRPEFSDFIWAKAASTVPFITPARNKTPITQICAWRRIVSPYVPTYQPRSISLLASSPITPTIYEAGLLSPNRVMMQLDGPEKHYDLTFNAAKPVVFTIEVLVLSSSARITDTIQLDNLPLTWLPPGESRPDVWVGLSPVAPGPHTLTHNNVKAFPVFDVFTDGVQLSPQPILQGTHPGYRMLLAEPVPDDNILAPLTGQGIHVRVEQTPSYLVLELPRVTHGRLTLEVLGPPGTVIDIGWDEKLYNAGQLHARPLPFPGSLHSYWSQIDSWVLDGNYREITTLDARVGRYILITIWGDGPVELHNLRVVEEHYPVALRGEFTSSNELLNRIWQVGVDTARINMTDAYADPWRERGQWWGDAYIVDRTNRVAFGQMELLHRGLMYMSNGFKNGYPVALAPHGLGNHMLDYGMLWVQSLEAYATLTQDQTFVAEIYPTLQAFLTYLEKKTNPNTRLLSVPVAAWSISTYIDTRAYYSRFGQSAAVNAMYYGTLHSAANLAEMLSDTASAEKWREQAENVKQQINAQLYMPNEGRYATTLLTQRIYAPDPYAQAWPLAYGIVPESEVPRVVAALLELLSTNPQNPNVDIYGMNWVLEALGRNGHIPEALALIERYYGYLLDAGATTWWETFTSSEQYDSARSHGWGSSPTWFLTTYVLGGRWTGPDSWVVRPALEGVASASGTLPIGEGEVSIAWEVQNCSLIEIEIRAPSHTEGELILPFADAEVLTLNGVIILKGENSLIEDVSVLADGIHITLSKRPQYSLTIERPCP